MFVCWVSCSVSFISSFFEIKRKNNNNNNNNKYINRMAGVSFNNVTEDRALEGISFVTSQTVHIFVLL